jgi:glycosyltransferase involved in cell wall biosynthesis
MDADFTFGRAGDFEERGPIARVLHLLTALNADAIVANCAEVASAFRKRFPGQSICLIPNGLQIEPVRQGEPMHILWIAKLIKVKNPSAFVRLAKQLPQVRFVMYGSGSLGDEISEQAREVPNLNLVPGGNEQEKKRLLETAFAFVSTSASESFPNTLIEAGIHQLPYISFVDPDEVICHYKLGFHVRSFRELVGATQCLARNSELRAWMGHNIRTYVQKQHDIRKTVAAYDRLLRSLLMQRRTWSKRSPEPTGAQA